MANDVTKVLRYVLRADAVQAKKALEEFDGATKKSEATMSQAARRMSSDLGKVEEAAKRTARANKNVAAPGGAAGGAVRNVAEAALQGTVSPLSTIQSSLLGQFGGAEKILSGVSTAALGAGVAVAGLGVVVAKFGTDAVQAFRTAADAVDAFQDVAGGSAEAASKFVNAARLLGVNSEAVGRSMAYLLKNVNGNEDALRRYGASVVRASDGTIDTIATTKSIAAAFAALPDPARRAELGALAFGRTWKDMVDILERGGQPLENVFDAASKGPIFSDEDLAKAKLFEIRLQQVGLAWDKLKVNVGGQILGDLSDTINGLQVIYDKLVAINDIGPKLGGDTAKSGFFSVLKGIAESAPVIGPVVGLYDTAGSALMHLGRSAEDTSGKFDPLATEMDYTGWEAQFLAEKANVTAGAIYTLQASLASVQSSFQNLHFGQLNAIKSQDDFQSSLDGLDDLSAKASADIDAVGKAAASSAKQIASAQRAIDDANEGLGEAISDQAKTVEEANRRMAEAEETTSERIVDAQKRIVDARERADRQLRDANQRLEDARQGFQDALSDALREEDPYKANRRREEAARDLTRAEQDFADSQSDAAKSVADAQDDLADAEVQAVKDREEAHRRYADTLEAANKRVADAQDRVDEAGRRMTETLDDAASAQENAGRKAGGHAVSLQDVNSWSQTLVNNTGALVASMIARGASWDEIKAKIDAAKGKLAEAEQKFHDVGYSAEVYTGILLGIPTDILTTVHLTLDAYLFKSQLAQAAKDFKDTMTQQYVGLGVADVPGVSYNLPQLTRDSGGPLPPGSSIVHNLTGQTEWVLTAQQMRGMAGGTTINLNVNGSVLAERDLASMLARLKRQGYNVGGN